MAFICCMCNYTTNQFQYLIKHYRFGHGNDPRFNISCAIDGCAKNYRNVRAYQRHIRAKHEQFWYQIQRIHVPVVVPGDDHNLPLDIQDDNDAGGEVINDHEPVDVNIEVSSFLMKLREIHKTSQNSCSFVANKFVDILKFQRETIKQRVHETLERLDANIVDFNEAVLAEISQETGLEEAFSAFSNPKHLQKYVADSYDLVECQEYILGHDPVNRNPHTMQYVPILQTLKALLKCDDVLAEVYVGHQSVDEVLDFCDGSTFQQNLLFSTEPSSLQVQLYYDEFTVANPLGTHVQMLKFSAVYFVLGNLHPKHRSKLRMIQLVSLCPSFYVKKYGIAEMLFPLIEDLKVLEQEGISFQKDGIEHKFRGTVSFISADNLGSHEIGGFQTHFHHGRVCRMCNITTANLKEHFCADGLVLRTREMYDQQAQLVSANPGLSGTYGIKFNSVLNELQYYHVTNGLPPDIAHDLFEGVIPEVVCEVVKWCVSEGYFSLDYLNQRIKHFSYEGSDRTNKPSIMPGNQYTLRVKQTACQSWCLVRMLPLMVGHLVPEGCVKWVVLLKLLDVAEYCTTPEVTPALTAFLSELIQIFLQSYYSSFPNLTMKLKFHFLVHYPDMMLRFGPLINTWTLRFEGKHNYFKEISRPTKNRKNLCKTLAQRHELMQASYRTQSNLLSDDFINHTKGDLFPVRLLPRDIQNQLLPIVGPTECVYSVGTVSYNGASYSKGLAVVVGIGYRFAIIDICFIVSNEIYLLCTLVETVDYVFHLHAYNVEFGRKVVLLQPSELHDYYPLGVYSSGDMNLISMRHYVKNV